ncbi:hypothetical protein GCM10027447_25160 [Glycomyces halotolerans]
MGHLPSAAPEEEGAPGETDPNLRGYEQQPAPTPGDYADLAPSEPAQSTDYFPQEQQQEPEAPQQTQGEWAPSDMTGQWPPPENQDWITQQARSGGWGAQNTAWPPEGQEGAQQAPDAGAPYEADRLQAQQAAAFPAAPQQTEQPHARQDPGFPGESYPPEPLPHQRRAAPGATAPQPEAPSAPPQAEPAPAEKKVVTPPPTHEGVRYAIYGIGGIITLGLIIAIVVMLGGPPADEPADADTQTEGGEPSAEATGELTAERYAELAGAVGTATWFEWRYGTPGENAATEELPQVGGDAVAGEPLFGEADRSVQGQLAYVTDEAGLSGIDHVTAVEANDTAIGLAPRAGGRFSEDGRPELELVEGSTAECVSGLGGDLGSPVALARPEQSGEVNAHAAIVFSSGVLATTGISGAQGGTCVQLPDGHVPTDVALTDGNELALVTTWQPESQTGSLVVVALADKAGSYQSSWTESYPGLPNPGHFGAAETVGTVELPFTAPTSIDAWSNSSGSLLLGRATIEETPQQDTVATAGHALIGSQAEGQVVVVDLASTLAGLAARNYEGAEFAFDATAGDVLDVGEVADVATDGETLAVATADGMIRTYSPDLAEADAVEVAAGPTCLELGAQSGEFIVTSRGDATVRWVSGGQVTGELSDARLTDPVCASETPNLDVADYPANATVLLVSDYSGQALHSYLIGEATLAGGGSVGGDGFAYGGSYGVSGNPFDASVTLDLE